MAAPTVTARNSSQEATPVTSHTVNLPATLNTGEHIIVAFNCIGGAAQVVTWPSGYTNIAQGGLGGGGGVFIAAAYREIDGTEGSTITVTTSSSVESVHRTIAVDCDAPTGGTVATANNTSATWNSVSVTSGDYLGLALLSIGDSGVTSGTPTSYGQQFTADTGGGDAVTGYFWERALTGVTSIAPSGTTLSVGERWATLAIALPEASGGSSHSLLADDVESDSEVSSPSISQVHDLAPTSVESASEVSSPAITQVHGLTADDVESASEVSSPGLSESHSLTADDVESASEVTAPSIGQVHAILADDLESASEVGSPSITQAHALTADDVESASEVTAPNLAVGADHNLLADDIESASEVSAPALAQVHALLAEDIQSASEVSAPSVDDGTVQPSLGKKGGRSRRTIRYIVEIDGERIPTASIQEAEALLSQAVEVAEESADRDVRRSIRIKPPRISVRTGSGKQTASVSLQRTVKRSQARVAEIYDKARERIETEREISRLIQRRIRDEDEEEAILALLL